MPDVVTHRYDPAIGVCPNICSLPDFEALRVLDQLRRKFRPTLKRNYLARRRNNEQWLSESASEVLGRGLDQRPGYFFLGDFSPYGQMSSGGAPPAASGRANPRGRILAQRLLARHAPGSSWGLCSMVRGRPVPPPVVMHFRSVLWATIRSSSPPAASSLQ